LHKFRIVFTSANDMKRQSIIIISFIFIFLLTALSSVSVAEWEFQESGVTVTLNDVCFVDDMHGLEIGSNRKSQFTTIGFF